MRKIAASIWPEKTIEEQNGGNIMLDTIYSLYDLWIAPNLWAIAIALAIAILAIRILLPMVIRGFARWKNYSGTRNFNPSTWFAMQSRPLFRAQSILLASSGLRELFAPASNFIRDLTDQEKEKGTMGFGAAWLSPYPRAVKASIKANRGMARGKKLDATGQIRELAKQITLAPLDKQFGGGDDSQHFEISIDLHGHSADEIARIEGKISSQLDLVDLSPIPGHRGGRGMAYQAHRTAPVDALMKEKIGADFLMENPAKSPYLLPICINAQMEPRGLPLHHTLILGTTGSGKSSPLNDIIFQEAEFVEQGVVEFYGIDPKRSELRPYEGSWLFKDVVYGMQESVQLIGHIEGLLTKRSKANPMNLSKGQLGRQMKPSKTHPIVILMIDEILSLVGDLQTNRQSASINQLTKIMAMGRSLNIFVVGATQNADKSILGWMRPNIGNAIVLRQPSVYYNDLFLGAGAAAQGFDSTIIAPANQANQYRTAGMGYMLGPTGEPEKIRFAYTSDAEIAALIQRHPGKGIATAPSSPVAPVPAPYAPTPAAPSLAKGVSLQEAAGGPRPVSAEESRAEQMMAALRRSQAR
ncbi:hypothetical protein HNR16_000754 [Pseudoclavibacter chungangensis]|nr:FtsK/SpoIIIE domain-containing protein [Pseudoclavibacter chungangensis]NYJ65966.1 hypothetical protein [Pseudoclavibacter chungangensis]